MRFKSSSRLVYTFILFPPRFRSPSPVIPSFEIVRISMTDPRTNTEVVMASSASSVSNGIRHAGPHLGVVATVFVVLFLAGLYPVTMFGGQPYFPGPWESGDTIVTFFQTRSAGGPRDCLPPLWRSDSPWDIHRDHRKSFAISRRARSRRLHRALWRLCDRIYHDSVFVNVVDIDATGDYTRPNTRSGALLAGSGSRRKWILGAVRPADCRNIDPCLADEIAAEVDRYSGTPDRDLWRAELDQPDRS